MTQKDKKELHIYFANKIRNHGQTITKEEEQKLNEDLRKALSEDLFSPGVFCRWLKEACINKNGEELDEVMFFGWLFDLFNEDSVKIIETISLENWVKENNLEDMVRLIENFGGQNKVRSLAAMALQKYPDHYLGDEDEYVTRKAIWALHRLYENSGREDALEQIRQLSVCGDSMVEEFAKHHLEKIQNGVK